ncbi:hypothetical protein ACFL27_26645, partial [candidate division CSSED10-310 bacterium]
AKISIMKHRLPVFLSFQREADLRQPSCLLTIIHQLDLLAQSNIEKREAGWRPFQRLVGLFFLMIFDKLKWFNCFF